MLFHLLSRYLSSETESFLTSRVSVKLLLMVEFEHNYLLELPEMIKHIVIWKLNNKTLPLEECEDALAIKDALENLVGKIPGLLKAEVGVDFRGKETSGDIVLYSEFESKEALENYQDHPEHVQVGRDIVRPRTFDRKMIDYQV